MLSVLCCCPNWLLYYFRPLEQCSGRAMCNVHINLYASHTEGREWLPELNSRTEPKPASIIAPSSSPSPPPSSQPNRTYRGRRRRRVVLRSIALPEYVPFHSIRPSIWPVVRALREASHSFRESSFSFSSGDARKLGLVGFKTMREWLCAFFWWWLEKKKKKWCSKVLRQSLAWLVCGCINCGWLYPHIQVRFGFVDGNGAQTRQHSTIPVPLKFTHFSIHHDQAPLPGRAAFLNFSHSQFPKLWPVTECVAGKCCFPFDFSRDQVQKMTSKKKKNKKK